MDDPATQPASEAQPVPQQPLTDTNRPTTGNKHDDRLQRKKAAALQKLDKVRQSFNNQLATLTQQQERNRHSAQLIEHNTAAVEAAIASINVEVARGTDWTELQRILKDERDKGNPIARMIVALDLHTNTVTVALSQSMAHVRQGWVDSGREEERVEEVELDLSQSAYNNASLYYTQRKQQTAKVNQTTATSERALRAVERRTAQQLKDSDVRSRIQQVRRSYWWERYHWFVTSENFLVIAGRDVQQSQLIVQRHLAPSDAYVCADVSGAVGVIVKNSSTTAAVPPLSIQQAACMCLCRSTAWMCKPGSGSGDAWWVRGEELEVAGEGGKAGVKAGVVRRYVTRMPLVMGLAVLFRVSDECIAAHKGERRIKGGVAEEGTGGEKKEEEEDEDETEEEEHSEGKNGDGDDEKAEHDDEDEDGDDDGEEDDKQWAEEVRGRQHSSGSNTAATKGGAESLTAAVKGLNLRGADVREAARQLGGESEEDSKSQGDGRSSHAQTGRKESVSKKATKKKTSAADKRKSKQADDTSHTGSANSVSADDDISSEDLRDSRAVSRQQQSDKASKGGKAAAVVQLTRAQRAKQKKLAKYADQDDEDRIIAAQVLGLQTAKRRDSNNNKQQQHSQRREKETEEEADAQEDGAQETSEAAVAAAPAAAVPANASATTASKPATAAQVDPANIICRGCKEKGHAYRECPDRPQRNPAQQQQQNDTAADEQSAGYSLDLVDALTGRPTASDQLLFAVCVCAPYSALVEYKYRVKLLPGSQKKGKVVQAAVSMWTRAAGGREAERDVIRGVREDEAMGVLCANVKIAAGMAGEKGKKRRKEGGGKEAAD